MAYGFLGAGFLLLVLGSEAAVQGGVAAARALGISPLLIGIFVISLAGSTPELAVTLQGALQGSPDLALGNVVGSNILNVLLTLGLASLIRPLPSPPKIVLRDGGSMLAASSMLALLSWDHFFSRGNGFLLLCAFAAYLALVFFTDWRRSQDHAPASARAAMRIAANNISGSAGLFVFAFGMVCLALGAHLVVGGAVRIASSLHYSEAMVGLTIVAMGTSFPELLFTVVAAVRGETDLAIGNLIGSNVINILGVIGLVSVIHPLSLAPSLASVDILIMVAAAAILPPMLSTQWRLSRPQGALLLFCYAAYLAFLAWRVGLLGAHGAVLG
jgi:cation:H+ antiporter